MQPFRSGIAHGHEFEYDFVQHTGHGIPSRRTPLPLSSELVTDNRRHLGPEHHPGRIQATVGEDSAHYSSSSREQILSFGPETTSGNGSCRVPHPEEGDYRDSSGRHFSRLLLPGVPSSKEGLGRNEDDHRFEDHQQILSTNTTAFYNGVNQKFTEGNPTRRVLYQHRPQGRLSPCSNTSEVQKVLEICHQRETFPIPGPSIRHIGGTLVIYPPDKAYTSVLPSKESKHARVHRRLPGKRYRREKAPRKHSVTSSRFSSLGMDHPFRQVGLNSQNKDQILRCDPRFRFGESLSTQGEMDGNCPENSALVGDSRVINQELEIPHRLSYFHSRLDSQRQTECKNYPTMDKSIQTSPTGRLDPICSQCGNRTQMVAGRVQHLAGNSVSPTSTSSHNVYGRIHGGLGCTSGGFNCTREMVTRREQVPHQHFRDEGCQTSCPPLATFTHEFHSQDCHRQLISSGLHKQAGRNQITFSDAGNEATFSSDGFHNMSVFCETHPRQMEHPCRQLIQDRENCSHRMDTSSRCIQTDLTSLGISTDRSLCHQTKPQSSNICQSSSRSPGVGSGRLFHPVDEHVKLCISSNKDDSGGIIQNIQGESHSIPSSSSMASSNLVSFPVRPPSRYSSETSRLETPSIPTEIRQIPQEHTESPSSRVEVISRHLAKEGFSGEVSDAILGSVRPSTARLYNAKWNIFQQWRVSNNIHLRDITVPDIADFLMYLRLERKLKHGTIEGYRSAIASVCQLNNLDIGSSKPLTRLLRSFYIQDLTSPTIFPKWDLSIVLKSLMSAPYEPMDKVDLKFLSHKTAFLLALATAARVSEIHAIDYSSITHTENWTNISCRTIPEFIAKNQQAHSGPLGHRNFTIPALSPNLDRSDKQRLLCPVRALRWYLQQTSSFRRNRRRLFLSCHTNVDSEISKNTIASWLRKTIARAYVLSDREIRELRLCPHEIRALASSLASWRTVSVEQVVAACQWKRASTFTRFYLRDIQPSTAGLNSLGPVVAAQTITSA